LSAINLRYRKVTGDSFISVDVSASSEGVSGHERWSEESAMGGKECISLLHVDGHTMSKMFLKSSNLNESLECTGYRLNYKYQTTAYNSKEQSRWRSDSSRTINKRTYLEGTVSERFFLDSFLRPCRHYDGYIDGRSQIKVHTDERTQAHSALSSLTVTHPSTNRGRHCLTSVNVPLS